MPAATALFKVFCSLCSFGLLLTFAMAVPGRLSELLSRIASILDDRMSFEPFEAWFASLRLLLNMPLRRPLTLPNGDGCTPDVLPGLPSLITYFSVVGEWVAGSFTSSLNTRYKLDPEPAPSPMSVELRSTNKARSFS